MKTLLCFMLFAFLALFNSPPGYTAVNTDATYPITVSVEFPAVNLIYTAPMLSVIVHPPSVISYTLYSCTENRFIERPLNSGVPDAVVLLVNKCNPWLNYSTIQMYSRPPTNAGNTQLA